MQEHDKKVYEPTIGQKPINLSKIAYFAYTHVLNYKERGAFSADSFDTYSKRLIILRAMRKLGVRYNKAGEAYVPFFSKELVNQLLSDI